MSYPPRSAEHGLKVRVVARKMQDGVADHHIRERIIERHSLDGLDGKIRLRKRRRKPAGEGANALHRAHVRVNGVNFIPVPHEINNVSTGTAAGVQDSHSGRDAALQKLVEKIDVNLAELLLERRQGHIKNLAKRRGCAK